MDPLGLLSLGFLVSLSVLLSACGDRQTQSGDITTIESPTSVPLASLESTATPPVPFSGACPVPDHRSIRDRLSYHLSANARDDRRGGLYPTAGWRAAYAGSGSLDRSESTALTTGKMAQYNRNIGLRAGESVLIAGYHEMSFNVVQYLMTPAKLQSRPASGV